MTLTRKQKFFLLEFGPVALVVALLVGYNHYRDTHEPARQAEISTPFTAR